MNFINITKDVFPLLLRGMFVTIELTISALFFAVILGLAACFAHLSKRKVFNLLAKGYIGVIRGTPLLVQTFFVYFGVPQLFQSFGVDVRLTAFLAGTITLSLNAGAYMAEIFRGGVQAVDHGQMEAARSLGLSYGQAMRRVVLPQALRISIPSLMNQFIISLKDTSIISVISLADICYEAKIYIGRTMQSFVTWSVVGLFYLAVILVLSHVSARIEKRLSISDRKSHSS
ncbi:MAG: amino acid ABC transporter permease [Spirochaetaceae bacterium]|jgi:His/Glu/Gln/Arg/opine family amino acid ABC transporter permease subunit|nr:amino acid ABC transporter permease [Spirochaetaceae bacterium]